MNEIKDFKPCIIYDLSYILNTVVERNTQYTGYSRMISLVGNVKEKGNRDLIQNLIYYKKGPCWPFCFVVIITLF